MANIKEGDKIKNFILPIDGNRTIDTSKDMGNMYIVYFYPKDNTPGCTTEAIDFSHSHSFFKNKNVKVIGISKDSVEKHNNFKNKHDLKITLASDTEGKVCEDFGVWVEKSMYGRKYMGIERSTFLIDKNHVLKKVWRKVKVKNHVNEVMEVINNTLDNK